MFLCLPIHNDADAISRTTSFFFRCHLSNASWHYNAHDRPCLSSIAFRLEGNYLLVSETQVEKVYTYSNFWLSYVYVNLVLKTLKKLEFGRTLCPYTHDPHRSETCKCNHIRST
jgi:hypothetical protein